MRSHIALYGNTHIPRQFCPTCRRWSFVIDGIRQCCDRPTEDAPKRFRRISEPMSVRRYPSKSERERLLQEFGHCCAYCNRAFGTFFYTRNQRRRVKLAWDHCLPFMYSQNNKSTNFLPACYVCNGYKSDLVFQTLDEVKIYVQTKWEKILSKN